MSEKEPRTFWFSIPVFWVYIAGVLLCMVIVGVISSRIVDAIKPEMSAHPTVAAASETFTVQRYREMVATDNSALKQDVTRMSKVCGDPTAPKATCQADITLVHTWLIQFRTDLKNAKIPSCFYIVNGQIQDSLTAYLQAEQLLYNGVTLNYGPQVEQGLSAFQQTNVQMDAAVVTEQSINC